MLFEKLAFKNKIVLDEIEVNSEDLEALDKEKEKNKNKISDNIKRNILGKIVRCRLKKMEKVKAGKLDKIPVTILDVPSNPRGKQYINFNKIADIINYSTGDIINAKVISVKYTQGDIFLSIS